MAKSKRSLIPLRGSSEDWGPGRQQRNLERKEDYARKMAEQVNQGPPDFEKLLAQGVGGPPPRAAAKKKKKPVAAKKKKMTKK
jgi:hypothetical protein